MPNVKRASANPISISVSMELREEIARQVDAGAFESRTEFIEWACWMAIELQVVGVESFKYANDEGDAGVPPEVAANLPKMDLTVTPVYSDAAKKQEQDTSEGKQTATDGGEVADE